MRFNETGFPGEVETNKSNYFKDYERHGSTLADSIEYDLNFLKEAKGDKFIPDSLNNFLLGGCACRTSLDAMEDFIYRIRQKLSTNLFVIDLEKTAIENLKIAPSHYENINRHLVQGDLLRIPIQPSSIDYVRLDYLQNYIPLEKQRDFLLELRRILSRKGVIANMLTFVHEGETNARGYMSDGKSGCRIYYDATGIKILDLSRIFFKEIALGSGLSFEIKEEFTTYGNEDIAINYDRETEEYYREQGYEIHPFGGKARRKTAVDCSYIIMRH